MFNVKCAGEIFLFTSVLRSVFGSCHERKELAVAVQPSPAEQGFEQLPRRHLANVTFSLFNVQVSF